VQVIAPAWHEDVALALARQIDTILDQQAVAATARQRDHTFPETSRRRLKA
jgi:hypothetical protein